MTAKTTLQWVGSIFKGAWKKHQDVLALLVLAAFRVRRLSITALGREAAGSTVPKHAIKRVDRWLGNRRFDDRRAREQFLRLVVGSRREVLIAVDWTKLRRWPVLVAGVVHRGRAVPVLWSVADPAKLYKSQNAFEHGFFAWLKSCLPEGVQATVLLDRGFKRVELVSQLRRLKLSFVIRTGGNVHVHHRQYCGRMDQLIGRRGQRRDLAAAVLRPSRPVQVRVVGVWEKGFKEPWLLMTNLGAPLDHIVWLYSKRFQIEEAFRDQKDWRLGLQLGHTLIRKADRVDRMLLVAALVLFLALLVGAEARRRKLDRVFRANTERRRPTHSDFALGLFYGLRLRVNRSKLLRIFYHEGADVLRG